MAAQRSSAVTGQGSCASLKYWRAKSRRLGSSWHRKGSTSAGSSTPRRSAHRSAGSSASEREAIVRVDVRAGEEAVRGGVEAVESLDRDRVEDVPDGVAGDEVVVGAAGDAGDVERPDGEGAEEDADAGEEPTVGA